MSRMTEARKSVLHKYGDRVSFNKTERMLYGHDIAAIPSLVKPIVGKTIPDVVVQPENEAELVELMKWAYEERYALWQ